MLGRRPSRLFQLLNTQSFCCCPNASNFDADAYIQLHGANGEAIDYYQRQSKRAKSVLELGCGDARILQAIKQSNKRIEVAMGLELHPAFIRMCAPLRTDGIEVLEMDMVTFELDQKFDAVLIPSAALFCLGTEGRVLSCLSKIRNHLNTGGALYFDCYNVDDMAQEDWDWGDNAIAPDEQDEEGGIGEYGEHIATLPHYDVFELSRHERKTQTIDCQYTYVPIVDSKGGEWLNSNPDHEVDRYQTQYHLEHRYLLSDEIYTLLEIAGFEVQSFDGDFVGSKHQADSESMVVHATKTDTPDFSIYI
jgi:SAM-dependent methyltransferase